MAKELTSLAGQVVAVTGGARGIGRATATALIREGARVAIGDIDEAVVQRTAEELGSGTIGLGLDVADRDSFERFVAEVEQQLGPLDVLINNAGIMPLGYFSRESDATTQRMVDVNLYGVFYGSKLALARFEARDRGHLVNIASIAGKAGTAGGATYCATKHAVVGLSESIRHELRGSAVKISVVMPIGVNTELFSGLPQLKGLRTPEPEDVADAIVRALRTGRFDVYVPRMMNPIMRLRAVLPRGVVDGLDRVLKTNETLAHPDHAVRATYEARMEQTISAAAPPSSHGEPGAQELQEAV